MWTCFKRNIYEPAEVARWAASQDIVKTMDLVRKFSFDHGLLGEGASRSTRPGSNSPAARFSATRCQNALQP